MNTQFTMLSAKDLCTRSCMQLKMFREHPELKPQPNANQIQGCEYQHNLVKDIPGVIGEEMGNFIQVDNTRVYFSHDVLTNDSIIEIKYIDLNRDVADWYLNSCFVQCAIYLTLSRMCNYSFATAKFYLDAGNEYKTHTFTNDVHYYLYFGDDRYEIVLTDFLKIKEWIERKVNAINNWDDARAFDNTFKRKEFDYLKDFFTISLL